MIRKIVGFVSIVFLLFSSAANAASISFDDVFGPADIASPTITVPLLKFDPALGTLTKVTLTLDADTFAGSIAWDNEAGISTDVDLGIGAEVDASVPGSVLAAVAVPLQLGSALGVDADNDAAADFIGTDSFAVVGGSGSDSDMDMTSAPGDLAFFTAAFLGETFDTEVDSVAETFVSTTGGFGPIDILAGDIEGTVTVIYEYDPVVPEPSSLVLAALAAFGALTCGRRR